MGKVPKRRGAGLTRTVLITVIGLMISLARLRERWSGADGDSDHPNSVDWRTQASALSALIADISPQKDK